MPRGAREPARCRCRRAEPRSDRDTRQGTSSCCHSCRRPCQPTRLEIEELDRGHRPPPVEVGRRRVRPGLGGQVVAMGMIVVVEEADHRRSRLVHRREEARTQACRPPDDQVDRSRPVLLENFPAAVGVTEAALECPRPGHGRLSGDSADAENLELQALADRWRPARAGVGGVCVEPRAVAAPPDQPVGDGPEPTGKVGLNPEHVQRVLRHGPGARVVGTSQEVDAFRARPGSPDRAAGLVKRSGRVLSRRWRACRAERKPTMSNQARLTRRSGRTPCWRRPCGGRFRAE